MRDHDGLVGGSVEASQYPLYSHNAPLYSWAFPLWVSDAVKKRVFVLSLTVFVAVWNISLKIYLNFSGALMESASGRVAATTDLLQDGCEAFH